MEGEEQGSGLDARSSAVVAPATATWSFVALYLAFFAVLIARRWARARDAARADRGRRACWRVGALLAGALLAGRVHLDRIPFGVVLPDEVAVKEGADTNYRTSFDAHAGLRVRIVDQRSGLAARPPRQRPRRLGPRPGHRPI